MKNMTLVFLIVLLMTMTGCARVSKPSKYAVKGYTSNPDWSVARNTIRSAGLPDIKDKEIDRQTWVKLNEHTTLNATVFSTMAYLSDINQFGFATLPLSFLSWTVISNGPDLSKGSRVFAWMPRSMAHSPDEAIEVLAEALGKALERAAANISLPPPYQLSAAKPISTIDGKIKRVKIGLQLSGNSCGSQSDNKCRVSFYFTTAGVDGEAKPYQGLAPDFLGGGDAWVFSRYTTFIRLYPLFIEKNPQLKSTIISPLFLEATRYLPPWVSIYTNSFAINDKTHFPAVLNQGQLQLFVKPE